MASGHLKPRDWKMQNRGTVCVLKLRPELQSLLAVLLKSPNIQCVLSVVDPYTISLNLHSNHRRWPQVRKLRHRDNCDLFKEIHLISGELRLKPSLLTLSPPPHHCGLLLVCEMPQTSARTTSWQPLPQTALGSTSSRCRNLILSHSWEKKKSRSLQVCSELFCKREELRNEVGSVCL